MMTRRFESRGCLLLSNLFLFLLIILTTGCDIRSDLMRPLPSDAHLEEIFRSNKQEFETVVQMSNEDEKVERIAYEFTSVSGVGLSSITEQLGFSNERWDDYKARFRKLQLDAGIHRYEDGSIRFVAFASGLRSKGYFFTEDRIDCSENSLDNPELLRQKPRPCKKLDENWYLYLSN